MSSCVDSVQSSPFLGCFGPRDPHPGSGPTSSGHPAIGLLNLVILVLVFTDTSLLDPDLAQP